MSAPLSRDLTRNLPGNGGGKRSPEIDTYWRFTWHDGCFFTFKINTEIVAFNAAKDPAEVAAFVGRKVLRIRNASKAEFDDHFAGDQYPIKDPIYGIWDLAVCVNEDADGTADAVFMDEWWQALRSKACEGSSGVVMKYIVASAMILDHFLPDIQRCPAKQSAFCDALLWDPGEVHPELPIDHVAPRRAFAPIYDAIADKPPPVPPFKPGTRDRARTEWIKRYGKKLDENRIEALTDLLYAGAWRIRYFHKTGGVFPKLPGPRQGRGGASMTFDQYIRKECENCAHAMLAEWKGYVVGSKASAGGTASPPDYYSDDDFGMWFRSTKCIRTTGPAIDPDTNSQVFSYHPLHLAVFYIDVLEARNIALMAWLPFSGTHVTDQVHGVGKAPTVVAGAAPPALKRSASSPAVPRSSQGS